VGVASDLPRVAVIVVNWNDAADTISCLDSLATGAATPWRVYVVDNASTDGSPKQILAAHPEAMVIRSERNGGYAAAFNLGRARALVDGADYLWLLNNDVIVDRGALDALLEGDRSTSSAILAPVILYRDDRSTVWSSGGWLDWRLKSYHLDPEPARGSGYDLEWATGCSLFCSAGTARRVGPMDERYFLYLDDVDWCLRARARRVPIRLVPRARVYHAVSRSTRRVGSPFVAYYSWRNYYLLVREHGTWWQRAYVAGDLATRLLKSAIRYTLFPSYRRAPLYIARTRGLLDFVFGRFGESPSAVAALPSAPAARVTP
jgi:GT2 family glycosyltransferase